MQKKWYIIVACSVGVAALVFAGCRAAAASSDNDQAARETAEVRTDTLNIAVDASGSLVPGSEASLSFGSAGRVDKVFVDRGQAVRVGDPLARLATEDLELDVTQTQAMLAAAVANLEELVGDPRPEELAAQEASVRAAAAQVTAAAAIRDQLISGADEAQLASAEASLASATTQQKSAYDMHERTMTCRTFDLKAGTRLPDGTVVPEDTELEFCPGLGDPEESARYALAVADASLALAQAQLDELDAGPEDDDVQAARASVASAAAQRNAAQAQLDLLLTGPQDSEIEAARASVADAELALEQAQLRLAQATLTAPISGTVTYLELQPGEIANANASVAVVSDLDSLEATINLDESDAARVAEGQPAQVSPDAFPGIVLTGEVTYVSPAAVFESGLAVYPVTIRLSQTDALSTSTQPALLRAGMTVDVTITTATQDETLIVPLRAVRVEDGTAYVNRIAGKKTERVEVTLGLTSDTEAEITRGLSEGDVVAVVSSAGSSRDRGPGPIAVMHGAQ
jgi:HlyD family secretion protein